MKTRVQAFTATLVFSLVVLSPKPAPAIIRVYVTLSQIHKAAQDLIVAKVDSVDAGKNRVTLAEAVTLEELGKKVLLPRDRSITLDVTGHAALAGQLRPGDPAVIFVGRRGAAIHVADAWFQGKSSGEDDWAIVGPYDIARTFPGNTPSLVRALLKLRAGDAPLLDAVMHHTWHGDFMLQTLDVAAGAMAAADADADGMADLVVATEQGVRFYRGTGPGKAFAHATDPWGLSDATARQVAFADVNGDRKPDLLLDELYHNTGSRFERSRSGIGLQGQDVLAVALTDTTADGKPDAVVLSRDGTITVYKNPGEDAAWPPETPRRLWQGGEAPLAAHIGDWGDDGSPHAMVIRPSGLTRYSLAGETADLERLCGENPMYNGQPRYFPMNDFQASAAWDRNGGDGNLDLHVVTRQGKPKDLELVGRGHGAFFLNIEAGTWILEEQGGRVRRRQPGVAAMTPADMYGDGSSEMLILEEDGTLWQKDSPVYVRGKPIGEWEQ